MSFEKTVKQVQKEHAKNPKKVEALASKLLENPRAARVAAKKLKKMGYSFEEVLDQWSKLGVQPHIIDEVKTIW